jgi:glycogen debranching enzyme
MAEYPPDVRNEIKVLEDDTFFGSDDTGNVSQPGPYGLFSRDTRFLSRYQLMINGQCPQVLTSREVHYFSAAFFLSNPPLEGIPENVLGIVRHRFVGNGVHEELIIHNHYREPVVLQITLDLECDFADLFEVKSGYVEKKRRLICELDNEARALRNTYRRSDFVRKAFLFFSEKPQLETDQASFDMTLPVSGSWKLYIDMVLATEEGHACPPCEWSTFAEGEAELERSLQAWDWSVPHLASDSEDVNHTYRQSYTDLGALRLRAGEAGDESRLCAAGLPWFMTIFGRDTLITSYETLVFGTALAAGALRALAARQGTKREDFRDEEPGKILHEVRFGELTAFGDKPHSPYYGSVDATPLFLILLSEVYRWTRDRTLVHDLKANALQALEWIDAYGDRDGDGYVEYQTRSREGLRNQGWKDSGESILFSDGRLTEPPIALCEVQGYVYDAKQRMAELAEEVWGNRPLAERLRREAEDLKRRFNRDFWIDRRGGYFALALDGAKRQVDALSSNIGHLLWSGLVDGDGAERVVRQLMAEPLYSGWGVRTMCRDDAGFNPISYHNGTVWPHDNSLIAAGLARYGFRREASAAPGTSCAPPQALTTGSPKCLPATPASTATFRFATPRVQALKPGLLAPQSFYYGRYWDWSRTGISSG